MKSNRKVLLLIVILAAIVGLFSFNQSSIESSFVTINDDYINEDRVLSVIEELSSPSYNGRLVGTEGNYKTVSYLVDQFKKIGLTKPEALDSYTQPFNHLHVDSNKKAALKVVDEQSQVITEFNNLIDFIARSTWPYTKISGKVNAPMLYIGNETELHNKSRELSGKVLLFDFELVKNYAEKQFGFYELFEKAIKLNSNIKGIIMNCDYRRDGFFPVSKSLYLYTKNNGSFNEDGPMVLICRDETFTSLKDASINNNLVEIELNYELENCNSSNVLGVIEGSDENLRNEYIIIGAHLDHVGNNKDGTYNPGALDNASGIASLLEVARSIKQQNIAPKKTIIFIAFNAEEESLFGSKYYVNNPIYPLKKSTMINLDCLGSKGAPALGIAIAGESGYGLSKELKKYAKGFSLKTYEFHSRSSDHSPFTEAGVPSVLLIHPEKIPRMHTVNDIVDKTIDINKLCEAVRVVLYYLDQNAY